MSHSSPPFPSLPPLPQKHNLNLSAYTYTPSAIPSSNQLISSSNAHIPPFNPKYDSPTHNPYTFNDRPHTLSASNDLSKQNTFSNFVPSPINNPMAPSSFTHSYSQSAYFPSASYKPPTGSSLSGFHPTLPLPNMGSEMMYKTTFPTYGGNTFEVGTGGGGVNASSPSRYGRVGYSALATPSFQTPSSNFNSSNPSSPFRYQLPPKPSAYESANQAS